MTDLDPRLVELYDLDNADGPDHDYFRALADQLQVRTIVDLGCGTGMLTVSLAQGDRRVVGVDPDRQMLDFARRRRDAETVEWVHGDSRLIVRADADLVVMSGNVAQAIVGDAWIRTLSDICRALTPGGTLTFESRNPDARAWSQWTQQETYGRKETSSGPLVEWMEVTHVSEDGTVTIDAHNVFEASNEHLTYIDQLAFRSQQQIQSDLEAAGLQVVAVHGGWLGQPVSPHSPLLVFEALRPHRRSPESR